ncbi:MAG TPA: DUF4124 domain-containing protein [Methylophaga sp.]|nr:DUF4124 domain-containing protein [Methylophaga sp.]
MIRKRLLCSSFLLSFCLAMTSVNAGQLFRFNDESGTPTLSKTLPPEAAQRGYDILDDQTMRLIERVPPALTKAELAEQAELKAAEQAAQQAADAKAKQAAVLKRQQSLHDQNLLNIYQSEDELLAARDKDLSYRQSRLQALTEKQPELEQRLTEVQQQAAEKELNGMPITENLQKRLTAAEQELSNNQLLIQQLQAEIMMLSQQYEQDQQRLNELLSIRQH